MMMMIMMTMINDGAESDEGKPTDDVDYDDDYDDDYVGKACICTLFQHNHAHAFES